MRLAVDASTLVAEVLRARGRRLLADPALDLSVAADAWGETQHELRKRVAQLVERGHVQAEPATQLLDAALAAIAAAATVVPAEVYADRLDGARRRIPRDPRDAPTVALALVLDCGIWTGDRDFFGCGLPVWTTETLEQQLAAGRPA
ncbi:MAG TPA: PIN domain-containing protein [Chloroflexota bacterium]|nr:PIN domain-containing protein [Chloroflexota bacterium]